MKKHGTTMVLVAIFVAGMAIFLYPTVSSWWNAWMQARIVTSFEENVAELGFGEHTAAIVEAQKYNEWLAGLPYPLATVTEEDREYEELLNLTRVGVMGSLAIEKIGVSLPIYHGTSEGVLQVGVGHMVGTSLPVGGKGTHAALTGHTGLPSSTLLTDLDMLEIGDQFDLRIVGYDLKYQVDQILVVEPHETEPLRIDPEQDYVTLITCTPYGINSHRLLVRGTRVDAPWRVEPEKGPLKKAAEILWMIAGVSAALAGLGIMAEFTRALTARGKRKRAARKQARGLDAARRESQGEQAEEEDNADGASR